MNFRLVDLETEERQEDDARNHLVLADPRLQDFLAVRMLAHEVAVLQMTHLYTEQPAEEEKRGSEHRSRVSHCLEDGWILVCFTHQDIVIPEILIPATFVVTQDAAGMP